MKQNPQSSLASSSELQTSNFGLRTSDFFRPSDFGLRISALRRPPIAILGVPFDNVSTAEAIELIEQMVISRRPHYLVTANVDFLVQAQMDVELRRILFDAHLVLCDGTPLLWASRLLGNPLPERVAGADLVPLLIEVAAQKKYRLFFLGASPEAASRAVAKIRAQYPGVVIAGSYSPPFNKLLEMDHDEIKRRIVEAKPDLLFVSFGCPKQEKWIAMHYRALGVPVTVGVGATIDFLAGQVKRAPAWMQRTGTEWLFRLGQEPRRLFRRYVTDLWVFGWAFLGQWWRLQLRSRAPGHKQRKPGNSHPPSPGTPDRAENGLGETLPLQCIPMPPRLDLPAVRANSLAHPGTAPAGWDSDGARSQCPFTRSNPCRRPALPFGHGERGVYRQHGRGPAHPLAKKTPKCRPPDGPGRAQPRGPARPGLDAPGYLLCYSARSSFRADPH